MNIQIISQDTDGERTYYKFQGKRNEVEIITNAKLGYINVNYKNATHKAYRGPGKVFWSMYEAMNAYKSSEMKSFFRYIESVS